MSMVQYPSSDHPATVSMVPSFYYCSYNAILMLFFYAIDVVCVIIIVFDAIGHLNIFSNSSLIAIITTIPTEK